MKNSVLFLGSGGSLGIPVIGCQCPVCNSQNPKNKRLRPSILMELNGKVILVDAGPDFREQALRYKIDHIEGLIITHSHQDHIGGIDDLRIYNIRSNKSIPLLISDTSLHDLKERYSYIFNNKAQGVVAKFEVHELKDDVGTVQFLDETINYFSYGQHGTKVTGFRIGDFAYVTDISEYSESIFEELKGVKILVLSALRYTPSNLHFTVDQAIAFAQKVGPKKTYFTHIAHEIEHEKTSELLPEGVYLSYDGLKFFI